MNATMLQEIAKTTRELAKQLDINHMHSPQIFSAMLGKVIDFFVARHNEKKDAEPTVKPIKFTAPADSEVSVKPSTSNNTKKAVAE